MFLAKVYNKFSQQLEETPIISGSVSCAKIGAEESFSVGIFQTEYPIYSIVVKILSVEDNEYNRTTLRFHVISKTLNVAGPENYYNFIKLQIEVNNQVLLEGNVPDGNRILTDLNLNKTKQAKGNYRLISPTMAFYFKQH